MTRQKASGLTVKAFQNALSSLKGPRSKELRKQDILRLRADMYDLLDNITDEVKESILGGEVSVIKIAQKFEVGDTTFRKRAITVASKDDRYMVRVLRDQTSFPDESYSGRYRPGRNEQASFYVKIDNETLECEPGEFADEAYTRLEEITRGVEWMVNTEDDSRREESTGERGSYGGSCCGGYCGGGL